MSRFRADGSALIWTFDSETVRVEPWGKNSLRVRATASSRFTKDDLALLPFNGSDLGQASSAQNETEQHTIRMEDDGASLSNGNITAFISHSGKISFFNQNGGLLLQERDVSGALKLVARRFKPIIGGDFRLIMSFESNPDEKLYGMGQYQQELLNLKGCTLELAHRNSQASVPFLLSSLGYGFLWNNPAIGQVNFCANATEWHAESTKQLDYWITAGDSPAEIEQAYAKVTGTVPMMPEYGLGFWQCKLRYRTQDEILSIARKYKDLNIPLDVIVIDFFHWEHQGDWRFDAAYFPDPEAMVKELRSMGTELMVSVWPTVDYESENFNTMLEKGYLVRTEKGVRITMTFGGTTVFYDATNPEARSFVWETAKKNYYDKGIRIFWLDEAEPEYSVYDFDNYRYQAGPNVQIGNIYPLRYAQTFYEGMTAADQENVVNLLRCAWAGSQRYGALVWSGDIHSTFDSLRSQLRAGLNMGLAGIPWWTTDIGGFFGGSIEDPRFHHLLIRWFQYGAFCPVFRIHGDRHPTQKPLSDHGGGKMHSGADNEIWSYGEAAYTIFVKYIRLRELMRPYIRDLMADAHNAGDPVMRPLFYDFPQDKKCWEVDDQYMFGRDVLVAPILYRDNFSRTVWLPAGSEWTCAHTGAVYSGGQLLKAEAPIDVIPLYLRDGALPEVVSFLNA